VTQADEALEELARRLDRHPAGRYPVQHATTRFHMGALLLERDDPKAAAAVLEPAIELLARLPAEQAKVRNLWGVALRATGDLDESAAAFVSAAHGFEAAEMELERAAASFNLGLVRLQLGEPAAAATEFATAAEAFEREGALLQAAMARREQGSALLRAGRAAEAVPLLTRAFSEAERSADDAGRGQAANSLGLALLATGDVAGAVAALRRAVAAHPPGIRPEPHAMAKANLALAFEAAADRPRARLAAAQALAWGPPRGPVHDQSVVLLDRLGPPTDDLARMLDDEDQAHWPALIREEATRWLRLGQQEAEAAFAPLVAAMEGDRGPAIAEAWLHTLVEAPPEEMSTLVRLAWRVAEGRSAFVAVVREAIIAVPPPQLFRLEAVFAAETDLDPRR